MSLEILIGADVAPTASNMKAFQSESPNLLFNGLSDVWHRADARIINLESPLTDESNAADKCGPSLRASTACVNGIAALNPTGVCLCNNHIMDFGAAGLDTTFSALKSKHIPYFGAGEDLDEADRAYYFVKNGIRVGVYAVCEHEFSFATDRASGANPIDPLNIGDRIRELKSGCDRLIVLYHGGRERYPYPSPDVQKICRKIAECGASLIICQHNHCVSCYERWDNTTIVYGQGNFIFDVSDGGEEFDTGLLVHYKIGDYGADSVEYIPIVRVDGGAALADEAKATEIIGAFQKRSLRIRMEGFVPARYRVYATEEKEKLFRVFMSGNIILRSLSVFTGRRPARIYSRQSKMNILNTIRCESIRELIIEGLVGEKSNLLR